MNEQPNKGGRPLNDETPADGIITCRVTMERKNRFVKAAKAMGLSLCAWLARVGDAATGHSTDDKDKP